MPRKVRGRPVAYGPAQLRALDVFLREDYLMNLSGDPAMLLEGEPFWEDGNAYFDPDDFHIAVLDKTDFKVSGWQTANALTKIGIRSVQRRFENGVRRRIRVVPIPKGAECQTSPQAMADYWTERGPSWVGSDTGEDYLAFKNEYKLHGPSRAAYRFVRGVFGDYPEDKGKRLLEALNSWDAEGVMAEFDNTLEVTPHEGGYRVQHRYETESGYLVLHGWFKWSEHMASDYMAQPLPEVAGLLGNTPDSTLAVLVE